MGLRESLKRRVIGIVDKEQRDAIREEKQIAADNRHVDRIEKEQTLKEANLGERIERRKMIRGEEPLSIRKYAASRGREAKNNAKINIMNTFNRDNAKEATVSGAKAVGRGIVKGGAYAGTRLAEASVQSYSSGSKHRSKSYRGPSLAEEMGFVSQPERRSKRTESNNDVFGLGDTRAMFSNDFSGVYGSSAPAKRTSKKGHKKRERIEDNNFGFGSSLDKGIFEQDFSSIYGHSSRGKKSKKGSNNPFDIDSSAFGF